MTRVVMIEAVTIVADQGLGLLEVALHGRVKELATIGEDEALSSMQVDQGVHLCEVILCELHLQPPPLQRRP